MRKKNINFSEMTLGVCYYPEHWDSKLWASDLDRMLDSGIKVIRIGEFAWSKFEPTEGDFTYKFFDSFFDIADKKDIKVIFCTPSATPPAWLTNKYPEVLNSDMYGNKYYHGHRRHYNYNSEKYREFVSIIVEKISSHYGNKSNIIGWQIDNEINCETDNFYSASDHLSFREFLKNKYKTLDKLNECWGNAFWNQEYTDWEQVHLRRNTVDQAINPHLLLDEKRFISESAISFCKMQADIIRKNSKNQFVTTNGLFGHLDSHKMTEEVLDFINYDSYPNMSRVIDKSDEITKLYGGSDFGDRYWSLFLAKTRSISENFGIMEQQSGANGWFERLVGESPKPGQMRLWTMQSVASGADFISYFRWRTCSCGQEIYWHGIVDYSNEDSRKIKEVKTISENFKCISEVAQSKYKANVAIIHDYDNEWDGEYDKWHGPLRNYSVSNWFIALQKKHIPMDFVNLNDNTDPSDLSRYEYIVYPHATIFTEEKKDILLEYVKNGGKLLFGARSGYKDIYGRCPMRPLLGYVGELCGAKSNDFTFLKINDMSNKIKWGDKVFAASYFVDILNIAENGESVATFESNYFAGSCAIVQSKIGSGISYYFGSGFSEEACNVFIDKLGIKSPAIGDFKLHESVEFAIRQKGETKYYFILNYKEETLDIEILNKKIDMLSGKEVYGKMTIEPFGVFILKSI